MIDRITLSVPSEDLSVRGLTSTLRLFELLIALRAISPSGELSNTWSILYRRYAEQILSTNFRRYGPFFNIRVSGGSFGSHFTDVDLESEEGADSSLFEAWISAEFVGINLLPIEDIRRGSYELVFQTVNLVAVFGLQDYPLTKDLVQWVVSVLRDILQKKNKESVTVSSGKASVRISPDLVRALQSFDDVTLTEERTDEKTTLRLRLKKNNNASGSLG
jgi:hypothetical protein